MDESPRKVIQTFAPDKEHLEVVGESLAGNIRALRNEFDSLRNEFQLFRGEMEIRLDRLEGMTNQSRAEILTLRGDFREFRIQLKKFIAE